MWNIQQTEADYRREHLVRDWDNQRRSGWWRRLFGRTGAVGGPTRSASSPVRPATSATPATRAAREAAPPRIPAPADAARPERTHVGSSAA